ncbi:MAG: T9SS type A sorting domain-containing protein [Elusimicrobia bacterium]|nr:T9SS type A sorting domain-containing protein [Elusimicrobiota bacterium]
MKKLLIVVSSIILLPLSYLHATVFSGSYPDRDSYRTTTVNCSVTVLNLPAKPFNVYFYHSTTLQFTSSTTVLLTENQDYRVTGNQASVSYVTSNHLIEGENNWYRWAVTKGTTIDQSNPHQIIVTPNEPMTISIIEPDNNGFAYTQPYFEVSFDDVLDPNIIRVDNAVIDESSLIFKLEDANGTDVFSFTGNASGIYSPISNTLTYTHNTSLSEAGRYTLTVTATDRDYRSPYALTTTETAVFTVRDKDIVDLVPVPSPFNPNTEHCAIHYTLKSQATDVEINIYDMSYRFVRSIIRNETRSTGENTADVWDGKDFAGDPLANGVYFIELSTNNDKRYTSVILMRN